MRCSTLCARSALLRIPRIRPRQSKEEANPDGWCSEQPLFLDLPLRIFASNFLVLRNNFFLNHLPCFIVKRVSNVHVCTISPLSSRHEKKIAFFFAVGEPKTLNDKTVIYRNGCICLDTIIVGKTNLDT